MTKCYRPVAELLHKTDVSRDIRTRARDPAACLKIRLARLRDRFDVGIPEPARIVLGARRLDHRIVHYTRGMLSRVPGRGERTGTPAAHAAVERLPSVGDAVALHDSQLR